jgi:hypothetical protein
MEQKYFKNLKTTSGESITVISPGIWNQGAGPDFLKAHLKINGEDRLGDIEIHLTADDWTHHCHHQNTAYDNVILHVYFWKTKVLKQIQTSQEKQITQVCLEAHLTIPETKIIQLIDLELYPYREFVGSGRCAQTLFSELTDQKINDLFQIAADWRLKRKREYIETHSRDVSLNMSTGIALALGYKKNTESFLKLFLWIYQYRTIGEDALLALALGICGFFHPTCDKKWNESEYYKYLKASFLMLALNFESMPELDIHLSQVRPFNHPIRRIVYLVKMILDPKIPLLFAEIDQCWELNWKKINSVYGKTKLRSQLKELLPSYTDSYWNNHYLFEANTVHQFLPLMGHTLKDEIIVNTFLPFLHGPILNRNNEEEVNAFHAFYRHLPASKTSKTKYLTHRFFGDGPKGSLLNNAINVQGAHQVYKDFCMNYEASCVGCPFVERYLQTQLKS